MKPSKKRNGNRVGIIDWSAKKSVLKALYSVVSDKDLVVRVTGNTFAGDEHKDFVDKCYDTFRRWGESTPKGEKSLLFWKLIIQNYNLPDSAPLLWNCSVEDFIGFFSPADATTEIKVVVNELLADPSSGLSGEVRSRLRERYAPTPSALAWPSSGEMSSADAYCMVTPDGLRFRGPLSGLRNGRVQGFEFYMVPESAKAWTALIDSGNYAMYLDCLMSLRKMVASDVWTNAIDAGRHSVAVVLGGGGSPEKDATLIEGILRVVDRLEFVSVDISQYMIHESCEILKRRISGDLRTRVVIKRAQHNFLELDVTMSRPAHWDAAIWHLLGGTIGNCSEQDFFRSIKGPSRVGDLLVVGVDTIDGSTAVEFDERMEAQYRSKELDELLLAPFFVTNAVKADDSTRPIVQVTTSENQGDDRYSDIENARTAVFSAEVFGSDIILATSTRYRLEDFLRFAYRHGWEHLSTEQPLSESTFRQLLLRRIR